MNIDQRLDLARQTLLASLPDQTQWLGVAASSLEQRIQELLAQIDSIQGGLWR